MKFIVLLLPLFLMACSPPVRIKDNQWKTVGGRSSDYGLSIDNLLACDEELIKLGFIKK